VYRERPSASARICPAALSPVCTLLAEIAAACEPEPVEALQPALQTRMKSVGTARRRFMGTPGSVRDGEEAVV
jgi:hypothetical protein